METLKGACIFGQSGGPTSVINSSAYGVFKTALENDNITRVLGAAHGIKGVLDDILYDIGKEDADQLELLLNTPSSALGSCRYKLKDPSVDDTDYRRILEIFKKYDVRYFFYNGGNDSMDTCSKISKYMQSQNYPCRVMGVPKTIDNDLYGTDHCPGYGSAAKYIATSCMEIYQDAHVYDTGTVTIVECMGRNAGWLTAAASLASLGGAAPDLIYMPEISFDLEKFVADVKKVYDKNGSCIAVVSEGIHDKDGVFISEYASKNASKADAFGHKQMGGVAAFLAAEIAEKTGAKTRPVEFSLLQRCGAHLASAVDVEEAFMMGQKAVLSAVEGHTDKMVAIKRLPGEGYSTEVILLDLSSVANAEHKFPLEWITNDGTGISEDFYKYALPLINGTPNRPSKDGLPLFAKLKKIKAE